MALQSELIDRLFVRLSAMYGMRFTDMWRGTDIAEVKRVWADALGMFIAEQIASALRTLTKDHTFPPTLPEFVSLCRKTTEKLPYELEKAPRVPMLPSNHPSATADARERCMETVARFKLQGPPNPRAWAYKILRLHAEGKYLGGPVGVENARKCVEMDGGASDPYADAKEAA